ncbi:SRPBCC family protein [Caulobacter sp. RL271]|uniref:SRPBCC family protein n=1 Tax=Caulobacter segnis TaxID=88688 RepID=A0ABY5A1A6_9CAUL|nr:SRPBCC family protein [Caulobacter segnis]USQ98659.1 SRPBCC family protein [Caulobacter segnis]
MRRLVPLLALLALAGPARAAAEWDVKDGGLAVEAHADDHGRGVVRASIDIAAPPAVVFKTILDCDRAARMSPGVKSCRVVSRASDGTEIREHAVKWSFLAPTMRSISRVTLQPDREIRFTCIGGDIRACEGFWRLEPLNGGQRTRVTYDLWATAPFAMPAGLISGMMRRNVPQSLKALRRECEGG